MHAKDIDTSDTSGMIRKAAWEIFALRCTFTGATSMWTMGSGQVTTLL